MASNTKTAVNPYADYPDEEEERQVAAPAPVQGRTVKVELVWPEARGAKIDCRGNTQIVWTGHGDVQDYPANLWHRLAPHPDVWRLVDAEDAVTAKAAIQAAVESPAQKVERLNLARRIAEQAKLDANEADRRAAEQAKAAGAQTNTDVVLARTPNDPPDPLSAEEAAERMANPDDAVDATRATPVPGPVFSTLNETDLAEMSDEDVHAEGSKRGYVLHPRLNPVNLRTRFLETQAEDEAERALQQRLLSTPGD